jgi:chaperone BCS1
MGNMMLSSMPKFNSGYIIIDTIYFLLLMILFNYINKTHIDYNYFYKIINRGKINQLVFETSDKKSSNRYRAIMYHISKNDNTNKKPVRKLIENIYTKYSHLTGTYDESNKSNYRVEQDEKFYVDENITGFVYNREDNITDTYGKAKVEIIYSIELSSLKLSLIELQNWVESKLQIYESYIKIKCDKQLLVDVKWDNTNKEVITNYNEWNSNVSFGNRFFTNKDKILDKIDFFIKNPEWYKSRGIPWTMGFLLWGKPGCGKTGFIKALMNKTGRSALRINLGGNFDFNELERIIYDDEINEDLIIPQENRIIIFEDIDCMSDIIKDRNLEESEEEIFEKKTKDKSIEDIIIASSITKMKEKNNNLSHLLNILDGLHECPGRIIIMTTNKPEIIDPALVRSGRIDYKIEFTHATLKDVQDILNFYWDKKIEITNLNIDLKYSHADIINFCRMSDSLEETVDKINL